MSAMMVTFTHPDLDRKILVNPFEILAAEPFLVKGRVPTFNEEIMKRAEAGEDIPQDEIEAGIIDHTDHFEFFGTDLHMANGTTIRVKEKAGAIARKLANAGVEFA